MRCNAGLEDATYDLPPRRQKTAPKMRPMPSVKENLQGQWQPRWNLAGASKTPGMSRPQLNSEQEESHA